MSTVGVDHRELRVRRKGDTRTQCGPESKIKLTVVARDPGKVKQAMAAFGSAISEFEKKRGTPDASTIYNEAVDTAWP